ncbi:hypothetical protein LOAG_12223 [Loa loa]|uniref:Uncharacterized protein n=1 Tax=Loa loa TaxID=7209 RepID=A0A1S0TM49_LOALO|nr:hypothetical protein LOAG_12223 [Loa loa]EFO16284.1 hypothetical protein LOAG_12223 [Loa loa]
MLHLDLPALNEMSVNRLQYIQRPIPVSDPTEPEHITRILTVFISEKEEGSNEMFHIHLIIPRLVVALFETIQAAFTIFVKSSVKNVLKYLQRTDGYDEDYRCGF